MPRTPLAIALLLALAFTTHAEAQTGRAERGQALARANCAGCHATGRTGESRLPEAPPFRDLHHRYPVDQLAEAFAEGISTGHPAMPEFCLTRAQAADLIAYLKTLER